MSQYSLADPSVGQVTNLISNDVNRFDGMSSSLPYLIVGPIQMIIVGLCVFAYVGKSGLLGIFILLLISTFHGNELSSCYSAFFRQLLLESDFCSGDWESFCENSNYSCPKNGSPCSPPERTNLRNAACKNFDVGTNIRRNHFGSKIVMAATRMKQMSYQN